MTASFTASLISRGVLKPVLFTAIDATAGAQPASATVTLVSPFASKGILAYRPYFCDTKYCAEGSTPLSSTYASPSSLLLAIPEPDPENNPRILLIAFLIVDPFLPDFFEDDELVLFAAAVSCFV